MKFLIWLSFLSILFLFCSSLSKNPNLSRNGCDLRFQLTTSQTGGETIPQLTFEDKRIKVSKIVYHDLSTISEDWMRAKKNGRFGFIDLEENEVSDFDFYFVGDFHDGYAVFRSGSNFRDPRGFVNKSGDLLDGQYFNMVYNFENGFAVVENKKKYGIMDRSGKIVIPIQYDFISGIHNGWAIFKREEHQGLINAKGQEKKFIHDKYDLRGYFYEGTIVFKHFKKMGIMDSNFNIIIPAIYDYLANFKEGLARFKLGNKWGYLDQKGNIAIDAKFDSEYDFQEGYASVTIGGKDGIIKPNGEYLIEPKFSHVSYFNEGLAVVEDGGKRGFVNTNAEWVIPPIFDQLGPLKDGVFTFAIKEKWGFANLRGCKNK
ncbi:WG repeat-containing protein [Leptospira jelokensis]|uniref:WG repeat-containing protein n=1 Tax=Leptospira jelokensis TaxID=2484931 RepID=UPI0010911BAA|nr:WG repeat-containing protein [Leptospira jelokensis]TGM01696.1 WG repeat-containing protein [Leptospira jelokensis]